MGFSNEIKTTRQKALLSQEAFAQEIESSVASINRWENGRGKPNISTMKHIKDFCKKTICHMKKLRKNGLKGPVMK